MSWLTILGLAVGLAMDAFAVSVAAGLTVRPVTPRHVFRLAFHFGLFQAMMPVIGWLAGRELAAQISAYDHWVAFALLTAVGGKMLYDARSDDSPDDASDPTRGLTLVALSVATSIDALAVGLSMALLGVSVWLPAVVIGLVTVVLCAVGASIGSRIPAAWAVRAKVLGGLILLAIGARILLAETLFAT